MLTRQNKAPTSIFEQIGDYFIAPLAFGFPVLKFDVITQNNRNFFYEILQDFLIIDTWPKHMGFKDVCEAQSRLKFDGRLYLSYDRHDFVYNQNCCICSNGLDSLVLKRQEPTAFAGNKQALSHYVRWQKTNLQTRLRRTSSWLLTLFDAGIIPTVDKNDTDDTASLIKF